MSMVKSLLLKEATQTITNMATEFERLIGFADAPEQPAKPIHKPVRLAQYMKERSVSYKQSLKSRTLPEDEPSSILRKKRDEVLKNIDKLVRILQEIKGIIIQRSNIDVISAQEGRIAQLISIASTCKVVLTDGQAAQIDMNAQPPEKTDTASGSPDKPKIEEDTAQENVAPEKKNFLNTMRSFTQLKRMISDKEQAPEVEDKPVNQARPKYVTKQSMNERTTRARNISVAFEMVQSKVFDPTPTVNVGSMQRLDLLSRPATQRDNISQLKEPAAQQRKSLAKPALNRLGVKPLSVKIKNSNFRFAEE